VDIFAQIGIPQTTFHETVIGCLIPMLATESDPAVLASVASALGHRRDPRAIAVVLPFRDHPDAYVRHGVVMALMAHDDDDAIAALITLSGDESALVRDWATFGLGSQSDRDTPAIRTALAARLDDPDDGAREEALRGLAQRRDPRVLEPLIAALRSPTVSRLVLETAVALGDPRLLPTLRSLRVGLAAPDDILEDAIAACDVPSP
jgi:HEAT repeat protein